jgi:hypothetical protein
MFASPEYTTSPETEHFSYAKRIPTTDNTIARIKAKTIFFMVFLISSFERSDDGMPYSQGGKNKIEQHLVTLKMSPLAARLSFRSNVSSGAKVENEDQNERLRTVAFRLHLSMGLVLAQMIKDFVGLPSGQSPREA